MLTFIKRFPLVTFFAISIGSFYLGAALLGIVPEALYPLFIYATALGALLVVAVTEGRAGVRAWASRIVRWRVGLQFLAEAGAFGLTTVMTGWMGTTVLAGHEIALSLASMTFMVPMGVAGAAAASPHSLVQELVNAGMLRPGDAHDHPQANVVTRAVGVSEELKLELVAGEARLGDLFLLASDGLTRVVDDSDLAAELTTGSLEATADRLIELVLERGAPDNVSLILIRYV